MGNGAGGFSISAHTKELIEDEVRRLIDEAYTKAKSILEEKREEWERLAQGLLEYETLTGDEIRRVMNGEPPEADDGDGSAPEVSKPSLVAIPKTKPKSSPGAGDGGLEPEPST
jgi:cell division protease FtsH